MTTIATTERRAGISTRPRASRVEAGAGLAFPLLFLAGVAVSNPPADDAPDKSWVANYTGHAEQARHLATGIFLVLAGLSLAVFVVGLVQRIRRAAPDVSFSPLPLVAIAASSGCIAAGGVVMAAVSGGELVGKYPLPGADVLRLSNDLGFALVGVAGMLAAALAVAVLSAQGRAAGVFGRRTATFGTVVAVILLASIAFIPIIAILVWTAVLAVQWLRNGDRVRTAG